MKSPFEELEYLADYLPDEGEAVVVSRRRGELICESYREKPEPTPAPPISVTTQQTTLSGSPAKVELPGISDAALYGRLLQANERLKGCIWNYVWPWILGIYWGCVAIHWLTDSGISAWPLDLGIGLIISIGALVWIQYQQWKLFHMEILPVIERQLAERETNKYMLLAQMKQHPELNLLVTVLSRWTT